MGNYLTARAMMIVTSALALSFSLVKKMVEYQKKPWNARNVTTGDHYPLPSDGGKLPYTGRPTRENREAQLIGEYPQDGKIQMNANAAIIKIFL